MDAPAEPIPSSVRLIAYVLSVAANPSNASSRIAMCPLSVTPIPMPFLDPVVALPSSTGPPLSPPTVV
jgi:hypothetical protein